MTSNSSLAFDEHPRGSGAAGATEEIARTLRESGIDAPSGLYDEALSLAREGHLSPAAERLRMLLCLDPTDADASLLLGKILATRGQFQEALANLDAAVTHGAVLPPGLRDRVEGGLHKQIRDAEEHRARVSARERGEVHTLRAEAKKLRSDNAGLELDVDELQRRVRMWSSATAVIAGVAAALLLASLLFGGGDDAPDVADEAVVAEAPAVVSPSADSIAATAGRASGDTPADPSAGPTAKTASVVPAATAPATRTKATTTQTHTVGKGDTLGKIAIDYYGKSSLWPTIQKANADKLGSGVDLKLGMKLTIPPAP